MLTGLRLTPDRRVWGCGDGYTILSASDFKEEKSMKNDLDVTGAHLTYAARKPLP